MTCLLLWRVTHGLVLLKRQQTLLQKEWKRYCRFITASTLYPKAFIYKALSNAPGGVHIVLWGRYPNGHVLIAMGYRYSSKKHYFSLWQTEQAQQHLILLTKWNLQMNLETLVSVVVHFIIFMNNCSNHTVLFVIHTEIRNVDRPQVISNFFCDSNCVDSNYHARQFELALEKKWVTHDCFFSF